MVIWITGLSGSGKTSVAKAVVARLRDSAPAVLLDGDAVREAIADPQTAHDRESRLRNAYRIARLAKLLEGQGLCVVVATMSLFHEIHEWNRASFARYFEVYLKVDPEVIRRRNPGGLLDRAMRGEACNVVGVHQDAEEPRCPDLILDNTEPREAFDDLANRVLAAL